MIIYVILVFILGIFAGAFLNINISCLKRGVPVFGSLTKCSICGSKVKLLDTVLLIKVLTHKRETGCCGVKINCENLVVELVTAFVLMLLYMKYGISADFLAFAFVMYILLASAFIDFGMRIIPNGLAAAGLVGSIPFLAYHLLHGLGIYGDRYWWNPFAGILAGSGTLMIIALLGIIIYRSDDAMGMGDVKIFAPIGIFLGWRMTLVALVLTVAISGVASLLLVAFRIKGRKETVPFAPFIAAGTFAAIMYGWNIFNWYLGSV